MSINYLIIKRKVVINYDKLDSESDGIYPIGVTNWEVAHAKNPSLPKDKYHRTSKNLLKTKELYPAIFQETKDKVIVFDKIGTDGITVDQGSSDSSFWNEITK